MRDPLIPIKLPPGFSNNGTPYDNKNRWIGGNLVRFVEGRPQPVGGWAARELTGSTMTGTPRAAVSFTLTTGAEVLVVGTTTGLWAITDDEVVEITPTHLDGTYWSSYGSKVLWSFDVFGAWLVAVPVVYDTETGAYTGGAPVYWDGNVDNLAALIEGGIGPTVSSMEVSNSVISLVTTAERFLMCLGGYRPGEEIVLHERRALDRMFFWGDQSTLGDWVASDTNAAGDLDLTTSGSLRAGRRTRAGTLLLTTTDAWLVRYIGGEYVHSLEVVGHGCGVIGINAAVTADVGVFWMGKDGFFTENGFVQPLDCTVRDSVFTALNRTYAHRVWGYHNATYGEVTWFYPTTTAECTNYVTYNYRDNTWVTGTLARTAGVGETPLSAKPLLLSAAGAVYDHETGNTRSGGSAYVETGPLEIGDGDQVMTVNGLMADGLSASHLNLTVYTRLTPLGTETTGGPYALTSTETSFRAKGRQIRLKFTEAASAAWRLGTMRLSARPGSRR